MVVILMKMEFVFKLNFSKSNNYICIECKPGYYLLKDSVYNICTNTDNCNSADRITSICTFCKTGYYLDLKDFKCKPKE